MAVLWGLINKELINKEQLSGRLLALGRHAFKAICFDILHRLSQRMCGVNLQKPVDRVNSYIFIRIFTVAARQQRAGAVY